MISFVVPAYNEEQLLGRTLDAIHAAGRSSGRPYEVIVVDDGSSDRTAAVARANAAQVVAVHVRHIARARNAGARAAAGTMLIFVDADTVVSAAAVRGAVAALDGGAAGGGVRVLFDGKLPLWARLFIPVLGVVMTAARLAAGCCVFCSRRAFDAAGGFDETLYAGEEIFFSRALARSGPVVILPDSVTTSGRKLRSHSGRDTLWFIAGLLRRGMAQVRSRERLALWYGERRDDPPGD